MSKQKPVHPGEILSEEFMKPLKISGYRLAKDISVPPIRISEIIRGMRAISADTALRLGRYFGTTAEFWLNLQIKYDLEVEVDRLDKKLKLIPIQPMKLLRGILKGTNTAIIREKDKL